MHALICIVHNPLKEKETNEYILSHYITVMLVVAIAVAIAAVEVLVVVVY